MTLFRPTLLLQRLVVLKSANSLFDERFHVGVNIIRGENSSGKSTVADLIFYALGGDVTEWSPQAAAADSVHAEVSINGSVFTLSRDIESGGHPSMYFFEGTLDDAMQNRERWLKYPYSRSSSSESFSQLLFRLLGMPEQRTEAAQNITMHQLLRLLYVDQMTPVDQLFRKERFDTQDTRSAIYDLLLGLDDLEIHAIRVKIRDLDRALESLVGELRALFAVFGKTDSSDISIIDLNEQLRRIQAERGELLARMDELQSANARSAVRGGAVDSAERISRELGEVTGNVERLKRVEQELAFDIEDSRAFVRTLRERLTALDASQGMAELLGAVKFPFCPACFAPIAEHREESCHLCHSALAPSGRIGGHLKVREELVFQERESARLLELKESELSRVQSERSVAEQTRGRLIRELDQFKRRGDPLEAEQANLLRRVGYLDRSVEELHKKASLAEIVQKKIAERDNTQSELQQARNSVEVHEARRKARTERVRSRVAALAIEALRQDLKFEEDFVNAETIEIDFAKNRLAVNGRTRFSASSATYLKNAVVFSVFEYSLEDAAVRWPRFLLLDNIEDKGMQPQRSANFQKFVVERSSQYDVVHQVIMTTSMISPDLEDSIYCVGAHYDADNKTLRYGRAAKVVE